MVGAPYLVALNLTRRCNLDCAHCYLDAGKRRDADPQELTTREVCALIGDIAALSDETMLVLSGGEPLLRPDIEQIAAHAAGLGLMVVVGTNGMALTDRRVAALKGAGVVGVGISVDSLDPGRHDAFRGLPGSFGRTMAGIDACRRGGLGFQIHFTVTDDTAGELDAMIAFAQSIGAIALNVFFLVCTGRGRYVSNISRAGYDRTLRHLTRAARAAEGIMIRAKCAPHFKRMAIELDAGWPITLAHGYEAGGCLAGTRYARVTPSGEITPCPYMEISAGSIRERGFADIWQDAPVFERLLSSAALDADEDDISGSGYVIHCLEASLWCAAQHPTRYRDAVLAAVNLGDDTDTTAAVTGALMGLNLGYQAIPPLWVEGLARRDAVFRLCRDFAERVVEEAEDARAEQAS